MPIDTPKPGHLGPEYAAQFQDEAVAAVYHLRPPYPDELFDVLAGLVVDEPGAVLDLGCGTGEIGRRLVQRVDRVDALDASRAMVERGRLGPGGDHPRLRWIVGPAETAPLSPPYALVVAAASIHWMDWPVVMDRIAASLTPRGWLVIVNEGLATRPPWMDQLLPIIVRYSTNREFRPYDPVEELRSRDLFRVEGWKRVGPVPFTQPVDDYVGSFHARNGLSRDRMRPDDAAAFDAEAAAVVAPHAEDGLVTLQVTASAVWGLPAATPRP